MKQRPTSAIEGTHQPTLRYTWKVRLSKCESRDWYSWDSQIILGRQILTHYEEQLSMINTIKIIK